MITKSITTGLTVNPNGYSSANSSYSSISGTYPITNAYANTGSTTYAQITCKTGTSVASYVSLTFDLSSIPSDATINSVSCVGKVRVSSTSYLATAVLQLYNNTTAMGSSVSARSITAANYTISSPGTWTRSALDNLQLRYTATRGTSNTTKTAYMYIYGANLTVNYTYNKIQYEVTTTITNGTLTSSASQAVDPNGSATVSFQGNSGTVFESFKINGTSYEPTESSGSYTYTISNITEDKTVAINFIEEIKYDITFNLTNAKLISPYIGGLSSTPLTRTQLNSMAVGETKDVMISSVARGLGIIKSTSTTLTYTAWVSPASDAFNGLDNSTLTEDDSANNEQLIYGQLTAHTSDNEYKFTLERVSGGFYIKNYNNQYLTATATSDSNLAWSTSPTLFTLAEQGSASHTSCVVIFDDNEKLVKIQMASNSWNVEIESTSVISSSYNGTYSLLYFYEIGAETSVYQATEGSNVTVSFSGTSSDVEFTSATVDGVSVTPTANGNIYSFALSNVTSNKTVNIVFSEVTKYFIKSSSGVWRRVKKFFRKTAEDTWTELSLFDDLEPMIRAKVLIRKIAQAVKTAMLTASSWTNDTQITSSAGAAETQSARCATDYVPVSSENRYFLSASNIGTGTTEIYGIAMYAYDADKNYLGRVAGPGYDVNLGSSYNNYFDVPTGYSGTETYESSYTDFEVTSYIFDNSGSVACSSTAYCYTGTIAYIRLRVLFNEDDTPFDTVANGGVQLYVLGEGGSSSGGQTFDGIGMIQEITNDIILSDELESGTYTLKYEDENNTPLEGWGEVATITK